MALSTRKKNKIIAEWKAGRYSNPSQVAKVYKIDYKTAKKIIYGISQDNAALTDALEVVEKAKKSIKNPIEIKAIEETVAQRVSTVEFDNKLVENNRKLLLHAQKTLSDNKEVLDMDNIRAFTGAVKDIESVANNPKNEPKTEINITQNQAQIVMTPEEKRKRIQRIRDDYIAG